VIERANTPILFELAKQFPVITVTGSRQIWDREPDISFWTSSVSNAVMTSGAPALNIFRRQMSR